MEKYGGKFEKRREETRERINREKISFVRNFCIILTLLIWASTLGFLGWKYRVVYTWNDDVIFKTREAWRAMDLLEEDLMNAALFLKGCRKDMVFQETADGFEIQIVESRNQSMEVLQGVPQYSDTAVAVYLGAGIRPGDELILCNKQEEKKVQLQVIRNNPKFNFHYLIFPENALLDRKDLPANLIKFTMVSYRWEKLPDGTEKLYRKFKDNEEQILQNVHSHQINYNLKDEGKSNFTLDLTLADQFPDGQMIKLRRNVPLESFQRLPKEMEGMVP